MDIFQILSDDDRIIVYSDAKSQLIYTWNQSLTLQCWEYLIHQDGNGMQFPRWEEVDAQTLQEIPLDYHQARDAAIKWSHS